MSSSTSCATTNYCNKSLQTLLEQLGEDIKIDEKTISSAYLFQLNYVCPRYLSSKEFLRISSTVASKHKQYGEQQLGKTKNRRYTSWDNDTESKTRQLRIGFVSGDLRDHVVARFAMAAFRDKSSTRNHSSIRFVYSMVDECLEDETSEKFKQYSHTWRRISGVCDEQVCQWIREDKIDILVDLSGHTSCKRLLIFASKPAPIQVTWLGYANTTGITGIDYRLTDHVADPEDSKQPFSECLFRKQGCFLSYDPSVRRLQYKRNSTPALTLGYFTFGSFNNLRKINPRVMELWAKILLAIPNSRLLIKGTEFNTNKFVTEEQGSFFVPITEIFSKQFSQLGISADRLILIPYDEDDEAHFESYRKIDLFLDTFPYSGTTTTCDCLVMGVPVLTYAPKHVHSARVTASLLSHVPLLHSFITTSDRKYFQRAVYYATHLNELQAIRSIVRAAFLKSDVCNNVLFKLQLEDTFREMWCKYCDKHNDPLKAEPNAACHYASNDVEKPIIRFCKRAREFVESILTNVKKFRSS